MEKPTTAVKGEGSSWAAGAVRVPSPRPERTRLPPRARSAPGRRTKAKFDPTTGADRNSPFAHAMRDGSANEGRRSTAALLARGQAARDTFRASLLQGAPSSTSAGGYAGPAVGSRFSFIYPRGGRAGERRTVLVESVAACRDLDGAPTYKISGGYSVW